MARTRKSEAGALQGQTQVQLPGVREEDLQALLRELEQHSAPYDHAALQAAQEKAYDAMEATTRRRRVALAREALTLSPLCADAYLLLGWDSNDPAEALEFYRRAVAAGAQAVGAAAFEEDVGFFWGLLETRPYMRARQQLALALWEGGALEEAIGHYEDMLRLNPDDNQGIRYLLLDALLEVGREEDAAVLAETYGDDEAAAAFWARALLAFRRSGDTPAARRALKKAQEANPHVADFLLKRKRLPKESPVLIGFGDESEAVAYVQNAARAWAAALGAVEWVGEVLEKRSAEKGVAKKSAFGKRQRKPREEEIQIDPDRIDDAVLALLLLGLHAGSRVWKSFDWKAMDRLHAKGFISNPATRNKSVVLSEEGLQEAERLHRALFGVRADRA
ncbi:MAG TPA: DUF6429 family protein [Kiloniellales bacterium]|nr:DUF6429 family protein [Kiloniellales bacterium]